MGVDLVAQHEVPQVEKGQRPLDQGELPKEEPRGKDGCRSKEKGETDYQPQSPQEATSQKIDLPW